MEKLTLSQVDQKKWQKNLVVFLAPVGIMYLTTLAGVIGQEHHVFSLKDFVPTSFMMGGFVLYFINAAIDYLKKLTA